MPKVQSSTLDLDGAQLQNAVLHNITGSGDWSDTIGGIVGFMSANDDKRIAFWDNQTSALVKVPRLDRAESVTGIYNFTNNFTVGSTTVIASLNADLLDGYNSSTTATQSTIPVYGTGGVLNVATPTASGHAATKGYVDSAVEGLDIKASCRVATTGSIADLSAVTVATIDGVTLVEGDRVLVKNTASPDGIDPLDAKYNGIYVVGVVSVGVAPLTRASDANVSADVTSGMFTFIGEGTVHANEGWTLTTDDPITLDTTALTFEQFSGAGQITAGNGIDKTGDTISLKVDGATTWTHGGLLYGSATSTVGASAALSGIIQGNGTSAPTGISGTQYGLPYFATTTTVASTAAGTSTQVLHGNAGGAPTWGSVSLTADVSGILPTANGGTGSSTLAGAGIVTTAGMTTSPNTIPKATGSTVLSDSTITDDGTTVTINTLTSLSTTKVGIGIAAGSADGRVHIWEGSAGTLTAATTVDGLVVENSTHTGITILTPDISDASIFFGTPTGTNATAFLASNYTSSYLQLATNYAGGTIQLRAAANVLAWTVSASASTLTGNGASTIATSSGNLIFQPVGVSSFGTDAQLNGNSVLWNEAGVRSWTMGTAASTGTLTLQSGDSAGVFRVYTASLYANGVLQVAGTGDSYILGNVGIGTTSPGRLLEVGVTGAAGVVGIARFSHSVGGNQRSWDIGVGEAASFGANDNFGIKDSSGGNTVLVIDTSGNVGIGTASPNYQLALSKASGSQSEIMLESGATGLSLGYQDVGSGRGAISNINNSGTTNNLLSLGFGAITAGVPANPVMTLDQSGKVGIGTTSPGSKLDILTDSLGVTQTDTSGLLLSTSTAAAAGAQQISPAARWRGYGWKTDATAASQSVDFQAYLLPIEGAAAPTGALVIKSSIAGGAYSEIARFNSGGVITDATAPNVARIKTFLIGNGSLTTCPVTHSFGTRNVGVEVIRVASPYDTIYPDVERQTTDIVDIKFRVAPTTGEYSVIVTA